MSALEPYVRALAVGAATGLRTFTGPAATARAGASAWTGLATTLALGELVADKLPFAPSRMEPPGLIARAVAGGLAGGAVAVRRSGKRTAGIAAGATAAVIGAWLGYTIRHYLTHDAGIPDPAVAVLEDAIAVVASVAANRPPIGD